MVPADAETERYFAHGVGDSIIVEGGYKDTMQKLFDSSGKAWAPYAIQSSTDLADSAGWQTVGTKSREEGIHTWSGTASGDAARCYRVLAVPE